MTLYYKASVGYAHGRTERESEDYAALKAWATQAVHAGATAATLYLAKDGGHTRWEPVLEITWRCTWRDGRGRQCRGVTFIKQRGEPVCAHHTRAGVEIEYPDATAPSEEAA